MRQSGTNQRSKRQVGPGKMIVLACWLWWIPACDDPAFTRLMANLSEMMLTDDRARAEDLSNLVEADLIQHIAFLPPQILAVAYFQLGLVTRIRKVPKHQQANELRRSYSHFSTCLTYLRRMPDVDPATRLQALMMHASACMQVGEYGTYQEAQISLVEFDAIMEQYPVLDAIYPGLRAGRMLTRSQALLYLGEVDASYNFCMAAIKMLNRTVLTLCKGRAEFARQRDHRDLPFTLLSPNIIPMDVRHPGHAMLCYEAELLLWGFAFIVTMRYIRDGDSQDGTRAKELVACCEWLFDLAQEHSDLETMVDLLPPGQMQDGVQGMLLAIYKQMPEMQRFAFIQSIRMRSLVIDIISTLSHAQISKYSHLLRLGRMSMQSASQQVTLIDPQDRTAFTAPMATLSELHLEFYEIMSTGTTDEDTTMRAVRTLLQKVADEVATLEVEAIAVPSLMPVVARLWILVGHLELAIRHFNEAKQAWKKAKEFYQNHNSTTHVLRVAQIDRLLRTIP